MSEETPNETLRAWVETWRAQARERRAAGEDPRDLECCASDIAETIGYDYE